MCLCVGRVEVPRKYDVFIVSVDSSHLRPLAPICDHFIVSVDSSVDSSPSRILAPRGFIPPGVPGSGPFSAQGVPGSGPFSAQGVPGSGLFSAQGVPGSGPPPRDPRTPDLKHSL